MFVLSGLFSLLITSINQLHFRQKLEFPYLETFLIFMQRPEYTVARFSRDEIQMSKFHVKKEHKNTKNIFLRIGDNGKNACAPVDIDLQMTVFPVVLIEGTYVSQRGFYSSLQVNRVSINVIFDHRIYLKSSLFLLVLCLSLLSPWLFFSSIGL